MIPGYEPTATSLEIIFAAPLSATLVLPNCDKTARGTHYSPKLLTAPRFMAVIISRPLVWMGCAAKALKKEL